MKEKRKLQPLLCKTIPWSNNGNVIWLGSTLSLERNIEKYKFPGKLPVDRRKQLLSIISKDILNSPYLKKPQLIKAEDVNPIEKEFLTEHFLSTQTFHHSHIGEAFILDETGEFLGVLNVKDHLQILYIDISGELEKTWDKLVKIETELGKNITFAFNSRFGFLTSDPMQCGTALVVSIFLQLSGLIHTNRFSEIISEKDESIRIEGLQGASNEFIGDIITLRNNYTLGLTEENIISSLRSLSTKLMVQEKSVRSQIRKSDDIEMKDKVSRAFGTLMHSYKIDAIEALNDISLVKLGLDLGWITGGTPTELNSLFFSVRRANLDFLYEEEIPQEEFPHKRAEFIHKSLKNFALAI